MRDLTMNEIENVSGGGWWQDLAGMLNNWLNGPAGDVEGYGEAPGFSGANTIEVYGGVHLMDAGGGYLAIYGDRGGDGVVDVEFTVSPTGHVYANGDQQGGFETYIGYLSPPP